MLLIFYNVRNKKKKRRVVTKKGSQFIPTRWATSFTYAASMLVVPLISCVNQREQKQNSKSKEKNRPKFMRYKKNPLFHSSQEFLLKYLSFFQVGSASMARMKVHRAASPILGMRSAITPTPPSPSPPSSSRKTIIINNYPTGPCN